MKLYRSVKQEIREFVSMEHRWKGSDKGLIWCWELGRQMREETPELAKRAQDGELMISGWKGGVDPASKIKSKKGTYNYLAEWQGLRGEDLNIDTDLPTTLVCSLSGVEVTYSKDGHKLEN